jgi:hypothetical protein
MTHLLRVQILLSIPRTVFTQAEGGEPAFDGFLHSVFQCGALCRMSAELSGVGVMRVRHAVGEA